MSFAVVLYATHTNWRVRAVNMEKERDEKSKKLTELENQKNNMETALKLENTLQVNSVIALTERVRQLTQDCEEAKDKVTELRADLAAQTAAVQASHETAEGLRKRLDGQSEALLVSQNEWMDMSTQLSKKIDEAHSLAIQVTTYQSVASQLAKDYADAIEVLRKHGLSSDPALYTKMPPAGIRGMVTEVRPRGIIEISIGSDSGLVKGHQLDVIRDRDGRSSYVGKIEITETAPDRAVASVLPAFRRGVVQRDDEVIYIEVNELTAH